MALREAERDFRDMSGPMHLPNTRLDVYAAVPCRGQALSSRRLGIMD
jgi:hypothetical protein